MLGKDSSAVILPQCPSTPSVIQQHQIVSIDTHASSIIFLFLSGTLGFVRKPSYEKQNMLQYLSRSTQGYRIRPTLEQRRKMRCLIFDFTHKVVIRLSSALNKNQVLTLGIVTRTKWSPLWRCGLEWYSHIQRPHDPTHKLGASKLLPQRSTNSQTSSPFYSQNADLPTPCPAQQPFRFPNSSTVT